MTLRAGDFVEHFVIVSPLGAGGMGQVYLARDTRLQRNVALKIMQPEPGGTGSARTSGGAARLLREAQSAAGLEHPNVVTIYEVGEVQGTGPDAGSPFIAMELVKGRPLRAYVGDAAVPMRERVRWMTDVARALAAAHAGGLVHRDVKPENVMIRDDGVVKVLDFGVAKRYSGPVSSTSSTEGHVLPSLTAKGVAVGTPYYMAPEQMRREALDGRADQFSWAVVAYELLSGTPPWGKDVDALELVSKLLTEQPAPLAEVAPDAPAHVARALTRALAKKREDRFASMNDVIGALESRGDEYAPTMPHLSVSEAPAPTPAGSAPEAPTKRSKPPPRPVPRWRRPSAYAVAGLVVIGVCALGVRSRVQHADATASVASPPASDAAGGGLRECSTHSECVKANGGRPSACNPNGSCVVLESEDCRPVAEPADLANDATVWMGAMARETDADLLHIQSLELARREIAHAGGLPAIAAGGQRRPLGVVLCATAAGEERPARHLAEIGVPVVIGGVRDVGTVTSIFLPQHVALIVANDDVRLTHLQPAANRPRLVWRANASARDVGAAAGALVSQLTSDAKRGDPRVLIVRSGLERTAQQADALISQLRIAGRPVHEAGDSLLEIDSNLAHPEPSSAEQDKIARFAPTVVANLGGDPEWFRAIERLVTKVPPVYVVTELAAMADIAAICDRDERGLHRFFLIDTPASTDENLKFAMRFNAMFGPRSTVTPGIAPSIQYDPVYVAALAIVAAGERPLTGDAIGEGIARLVGPGPKVEVGPSEIFDAFDVLQRGERIDLQGAGSPLDFDMDTGDSSVRLAIYCLRRGRTGLDFVESGASYRPETKAIAGTMRCP